MYITAPDLVGVGLGSGVSVGKASVGVKVIVAVGGTGLGVKVIVGVGVFEENIAPKFTCVPVNQKIRNAAPAMINTAAPTKSAIFPPDWFFRFR